MDKLKEIWIVAITIVIKGAYSGAPKKDTRYVCIDYTSPQGKSYSITNDMSEAEQFVSEGEAEKFIDVFMDNATVEEDMFVSIEKYKRQNK